MGRPISNQSSQPLIPENAYTTERTMQKVSTQGKDNVGIFRLGKRTFSVEIILEGQQAKVKDVEKMARLVAHFMFEKGALSTPHRIKVANITEMKTEVISKKTFEAPHDDKDKVKYYEIMSLVDQKAPTKIREATPPFPLDEDSRRFSISSTRSGRSDSFHSFVNEPFSSLPLPEPVEDELSYEEEMMKLHSKIVDLPLTSDGLFYGIAVGLERPADPQYLKDRQNIIPLIKKSKNIRSIAAGSLADLYLLEKQQIIELFNEEIAEREKAFEQSEDLFHSPKKITEKGSADSQLAREEREKTAHQEREKEIAHIEWLRHATVEEYIQATEERERLYGGLPHLFALAKVCNIPIKVISPDHPSRIFNPEGKGEMITLVQINSKTVGNSYKLVLN